MRSVVAFEHLGGLLVVAVEAAAQLGDLLGVDVEADDVGELAREGQRDGQADVAQADDGDAFGHFGVLRRRRS